jgi:hypothetical protein
LISHFLILFRFSNQLFFCGGWKRRWGGHGILQKLFSRKGIILLLLMNRWVPSDERKLTLFSWIVAYTLTFDFVCD